MGIHGKDTDRYMPYKYTISQRVHSLESQDATVVCV